MTFPIGIFDSGVGGLSVLQEIALVLPNENLIYVGDTENIPYGNKSVNEIRLFADRIVQFLLSCISSCVNMVTRKVFRNAFYWY